MGEIAFRFTQNLVDFGACIDCGVPIVGPQSHHTQRHRDKRSFYCINGHSQIFGGETPEEKAQRLQKELETEREAKRRAQAALSDARLEAEATKKKIRDHKQRARLGVCPCCKRSFTQLARHIATKHPDYAKEP